MIYSEINYYIKYHLEEQHDNVFVQHQFNDLHNIIIHTDFYVEEQRKWIIKRIIREAMKRIC